MDPNLFITEFSKTVFVFVSSVLSLASTLIVTSCLLLFVTVDKTNPDLVDYLNELREGVFEGLTGIVQGFRDAPNCSQILSPYLPGLVKFVEHLAADSSRSEEVCKRMT
jgi:hypothetical protein